MGRIDLREPMRDLWIQHAIVQYLQVSKYPCGVLIRGSAILTSVIMSATITEEYECTWLTQVPIRCRSDCILEAKGRIPRLVYVM